MRDDFEESVEMSTYLVAFVVCDYQYVHAQTLQGVAVRVYAPPELLSQTSFALSTATKVMDHYSDFFGVPYPLPKQGIILYNNGYNNNCTYVPIYNIAYFI